MRCTNKNEKTIPRERRSTYRREISRRRKQRRLIIQFVSLLVVLVLLLCGLGYEFLLKSHEIDLVRAYDKTDTAFGLTNISFDGDFSSSFASDLCVAPEEDVVLPDLSVDAVSAAIFSEADHQTVYAKAVHERRYPASLTKVMTCLVALKNGNLDQMITVGEECKDIDIGSSVCEIQPGDVLSLRELLLGLMINSGNDAAMTIAQNVGGTVENFVAMMNEEAAALGAVNTHFMNPHGLQDENHYTTVYDMYLIFHEALKNDDFRDIISHHSYYASFSTTAGEERNITWESTNHYFINEAVPPKDVEVVGGKTGTTSEAGACLVLLSKNKYGNPYVTIIMKEPDKESLYQEMNQLLGKINEK